jgi:hypothetical protein
MQACKHSNTYTHKHTQHTNKYKKNRVCYIHITYGRALRDQGLSIGTRTGKFPHLLPQIRSGPGTLYLKPRCWDREWILISTAKETGTGPEKDRDMTHTRMLACTHAHTLTQTNTLTDSQTHAHSLSNLYLLLARPTRRKETSL